MDKRRILISGRKPIINVTVALSEAEYERLQQYRPLTAYGTVENVIRGLLKLQPAPVGWQQRDKHYIVVKEHEYMEHLRREESDGR